jgi:hypothetical protein
MECTRKVVCLLFLSALSATTATAQRQQPASLVVPPKTMAVYDPAGKLQGAVGGTPGRYQLPDGTWHETLIYEIKPDRIYLGEAGKGISTAVFPEQITRFAVNGEVYGAVSGFRLKPGGRMIQPAFARQLFDAGGYTLLAYGEAEESFWVRLFGRRLLLRIGAEPILVLPTRTKSFNRLMLTIVGDNPDLARQLRANQFRAWPDAADILTTYVLTKKSLPK